MQDISQYSQLYPILLNLAAAVLGAVGQLFYKRGSLILSLVPVWKNVPLILGILSFCGVMILFVFGYRLGGKVSVAYPFYATTFIWSTLIANQFLQEQISPLQWVGIIAVAAGTATIAIGQSS